MTLVEDVRYGLRTWATNPGFVTVAVTALALGIGANATVFAITNGVLFKGMPFVDNERILYLSTKNLNRGARRAGVSYRDYQDWKAQAKSFNGLGAYGFQAFNVSDKTGLPDHYFGSRMASNNFQLIGQKPVIGRDFISADEQPGAPPVAILGYGIWETRYGKNPAIIGQTIRINDVPTTVVGVMQRGIVFPGQADLWTPLIPSADEKQKREVRNFSVIGLLAPGATEKSAGAEMETITHNLQIAYPVTNQGISGVVHTFSEEFNGPQITALFLALMGAVGFVLLIACANVANLLLARAIGRSREISIRVALGAGRWRVIRQLLVESLMLSITGGALGWLISKWGIRAFDAAVAGQKPAWMDFSMDYKGFAYLAAISIGTGLLFGLAPALRLSKLDVNNALKDGGRGSSGGGRGKYLSGLLVVAEMALAVILLAGAGVMIRSFLNVYTARIGVNTKNVLVMRLFLPEGKYPRDDDQVSFHQRLKARIDALPGVEVSTIAVTMPTGGGMNLPYELEGAPPVDEKNRQQITVLVISPDYFRAMDVGGLRGRFFTDSDGVAGPPVAIVNQRFAEKFWPSDDPIGKRFRLYDRGKPEAWLAVVGVVPNILQNDVSVREYDPLIYVPYRQKPLRDMSLMARTRVPPGSLGAAFRREVQAVDDNLPVYNLRTLEERLEINNWPFRVFGSLFAIFAGIALLLSSIGLYAVIAHSVSQRTQEIGVRLALGASGTNILRLIFAQGMVQSGVGLAIGLAGAFGLTRVLKAVLSNVSPTDPPTFITVSLLLAAAAALGSLLPARRAMRVDPVVALRNE